MDIAQHPLSAAFPPIPAEEFQALKDSIESIGLQTAITLYEGMVIDGWHRYQACLATNTPPQFRDLDPDVDPKDFVLAHNATRRHLTESQRAAAVVAVYQWQPNGTNRYGNSRSAPGADLEKSTKELAGIAGVAPRTIERAKKVEKDATPEIKDAVKKGEVSIKRAAEISKLPATEQVAALHEPPPKTPPAAEPEPDFDQKSHEVDELKATVVDLADENDRLKDCIAIGAIPEGEQQSAAETIEALRAEVKSLEAQLRAVTASRDRYQNENNELLKQLGMQRKELNKLRAA